MDYNQIIQGDTLDVVKSLPDNFVNMAMERISEKHKLDKELENHVVKKSYKERKGIT